jgi:hypothetical protein
MKGTARYLFSTHWNDNRLGGVTCFSVFGVTPFLRGKKKALAYQGLDDLF